MIKQSEELRTTLFNFQTLQNLRSIGGKEFDLNDIPDCVDILLFGPAGSGKSSLIQTFYRALHNKQILSEEIQNQVIVKDKNKNEGTTQYTGVVIKNREVLSLDEQTQQIISSSSIQVHDTRGQIWMDDKELGQLELIIKGKVKDMATVE